MQLRQDKSLWLQRLRATIRSTVLRTRRGLGSLILAMTSLNGHDYRYQTAFSACFFLSCCRLIKIPNPWREITEEQKKVINRVKHRQEFIASVARACMIRNGKKTWTKYKANLPRALTVAQQTDISKRRLNIQRNAGEGWELIGHSDSYRENRAGWLITQTTGTRPCRRSNPGMPLWLA